MSGRSDWCFSTPVDTTTLLSRAQACFDLCFGTPAGAMTLFLRGQARPDRCFGTPTGATTLLLRGQTKDQNIGKHGYIGNWILRKYRKYR